MTVTAAGTAPAGASVRVAVTCRSSRDRGRCPEEFAGAAANITRVPNTHPIRLITLPLPELSFHRLTCFRPVEPAGHQVRCAAGQSLHLDRPLEHPAHHLTGEDFGRLADSLDTTLVEQHHSIGVLGGRVELMGDREYA